MLSALEDASVFMSSCGSEGDSGVRTSGMRHLSTTGWHGVSLMVECEIHVTSEEGHQICSIEPPVDTIVSLDLLPDLSLLAGGCLSEVLWGVELISVREWARVQ